MKKRQLAILGSTGSIGTQALEVVSEHSDLFEVYALTANNQVDLLINQARKYMPEVVVIANERKYPELKEALEDLPIKVWAGADAIAQMVQSEPIDMVLTAMVGGYISMNSLRFSIPHYPLMNDVCIQILTFSFAVSSQYYSFLLPRESPRSAAQPYGDRK